MYVLPEYNLNTLNIIYRDQNYRNIEANEERSPLYCAAKIANFYDIFISLTRKLQFLTVLAR